MGDTVIAWPFGILGKGSEVETERLKKVLEDTRADKRWSSKMCECSFHRLETNDHALKYTPQKNANQYGFSFSKQAPLSPSGCAEAIT